MTGAGLGSPSSSSSGGGGYQGPGDIISGAQGFWSCTVAYNAAYAAAGGNACLLVDAATHAISYTMTFLSTGYANFAGAAASSACTIACDVKEAYDQSGNANHMTNSSGSTFAIGMSFSVLGPCGVAVGTGGGSFLENTSLTNAAQPFSISAVVNRTGATTTKAGIWGGIGGTAASFGYVGSANGGLFAAATTNLTRAVNDNTFVSTQVLFNNTSSSVSANGTTSSGTTGTATGTGGYYLGVDQNDNSYTGDLMLFGLWPSNISSSFAALNTQHRSLCGGF